MWTRVKGREEMSHSRVTVFDIDKDLEKDRVLKTVRAGAARGTNEMLFDPETFKGQEHALTKDQQRLPHDQLYHYAKVATQARQHFSEKAAAARSSESDRRDHGDEANAEMQAPQLKRNHLPKPREMIAPELLQGDGHNSGSRRRGKRSLAQVNAKTRLAIVEVALKKQLTQAEIADRFHVTAVIVKELVMGVKKNRSSIVKRYAAELKRS